MNNLLKKKTNLIHKSDLREIKTQAIRRLRRVATRIIQIIDAKLSFGSVSRILTGQTHARTHAQRGQTIAVVIIQNDGFETELIAIHE